MVEVAVDWRLIGTVVVGLRAKTPKGSVANCQSLAKRVEEVSKVRAPFKTVSPEPVKSLMESPPILKAPEPERVMPVLVA